MNRQLASTSRDHTPILALGQGLYYLATGVWALVSIRSFEAVTGPKTDRWLVKTVAVLVSAIGSTMAVSGARRRVAPETALLAAGSAAGLAAVETFYATTGRIAKIYLLDAVAEAALVVAWAVAARSSAGFAGAIESRGEVSEGAV